MKEQLNQNVIPSQKAFCAKRHLDLETIERLDYCQMKPILASVVRMGWCPTLDNSIEWTERRKQIQKMLSGIEVMNSVVNLLSFDVRKEQQLRLKCGSNPNDSLLISSLLIWCVSEKWKILQWSRWILNFENFHKSVNWTTIVLCQLFKFLRNCQKSPTFIELKNPRFLVILFDLDQLKWIFDTL